MDITQDYPIGTDETVINLAYHEMKTGDRGTDKYVVHYNAFFQEHRWETGEVASWSFDHVHPIDDRNCHQQLTARIERRVWYDNPRRSETEVQSKYTSTTALVISNQGTGPGTSNFFRSQNCGDCAAEFDQSRDQAKMVMQSRYPAFVTADRANLVRELIRDYKVEAKEA